jgi:hypothetical protein
MPGTATEGKLFFKFFLKDLARQNRPFGSVNRRGNKPVERGAYLFRGSPFRCLPVTGLVVRKIIRREQFVVRLRR